MHLPHVARASALAKRRRASHLPDVRAILALMMLAVLALGGAAPTCAHAMPAHPAMGHHNSMPAHDDAHAHADCIGCGTELPDPPRLLHKVFAPLALPPLVLRETVLVGTAPPLALPPPRA